MIQDYLPNRVCCSCPTNAQFLNPLSTEQPMRHGSPIIFLLWGRHFEEVDAAVFVSELRAVGLCVKVVGLEGRPMAGAHGLVVTPDLGLGQIAALAPRALGIVLPCRLVCLLHYGNDPRLIQFLQEAQQRQVTFLLRHSEVAEEDAEHWMTALHLGDALVPWVVYPSTQDLMPFVRTLAGIWSRKRDAGAAT